MEIDSDSIPLPTSQRLGSAISGVFLFFFGMPFTLAPLFILPGVFGESVMLSIFMVCFSIPFLLAGITVQITALMAFRLALFPNSEFAQKQWRKHAPINSEDYFSSKSPAEQRTQVREDQVESDGNFWSSVKPE